MKKFANKAAVSADAIGGADGPTSYFLLGGKNAKPTLRQRLHKLRYEFRKKRVVKALKPNPHSMDEVADYIINELGFSEVDKDEAEYKTEYYQMRASFILMYKPELLGELAEIPKLECHDEEGIKQMMAEIERRQKAAEEIPSESFDIDLHIFEKNDEENHTKIIMEKNYGYIGGSASGSANSVKRYNKVYRKVYEYYGVTQKDIDEKSKRYTEVVKTLALH